MGEVMRNCRPGCARTLPHAAPVGCTAAESIAAYFDKQMGKRHDEFMDQMVKQTVERFSEWPMTEGRKDDEIQQRTEQAYLVHPTLAKADALMRKKSEDYGTVGDNSKARYFPFGDKSYLQMITTKVNRLVELAERDEVNFESAFDSVLDCINYCAMYGAWLEEKAK